MSALNIETCRQHWESNEQWELRKEFLEAYKDKFDDAKLLCLAQVYTNIELLGCSYPAPVMLQVRELAKDLELGGKLQQTRKDRQSVQFVKEGNSSNSAKRGDSCIEEIPPVEHPIHPADHKKMKLFSKDSSSKTAEIKSETILPSTSQQLSMPVIKNNPIANPINKSTVLESKMAAVISSSSQLPSSADRTLIEKLQKLKELSNKIRKPILYGDNTESKCMIALHNICQKLGYSITYVTENTSGKNPEFTMTIKVLDVIIGKMSGASKKQMKGKVSKQAVDLLFNPAVKIVNDGGNFILKEDEEMKTEIETQQPALNSSSSSFPIGNSSVENCEQPEVFPLNPMLKQCFIILDNSTISDSSPVSLLSYSSQFCKVPINFECSTDDSRLPSVWWVCEVFLGGEIICKASALTKHEVKSLAAHVALDSLSKVLYTVQVKAVDADGFVVPRNQLLDCPETSTCLTDSNIGCKMLKMMGWSGGGIGKEGNTGISEPIKVANINERCGLGYSGEKNKNSNKKKCATQFRAKIESLLFDYAASNTFQDLVFSTDFSPEERKHIHTIAHKYHLKSCSRGKGEARYLTISRQVTCQELLSNLKAAGGSTGKYVLIAPH